MRVICDPVPILVNRSDNPPAAEVETDLMSELSRMQLNVTSDYYSGFRRSNIPSYRVSAIEYLTESDTKWKDKSLLCPEMPIPRDLSSSVQLIAPPRSVWSKQAVAMIHAGRRGCITPLHFDWDHTWVAHACLFGSKRFFLLPPEAGWLLNPVINTSALTIPRFSPSDRRELLTKLGGIEIKLEAGQGILFPSTFWHGALYEDSSLAISVRWEANAGGRPFAALPRSWLLQRLVWRFFRNGYVSEAGEFLNEYLKSFFAHTRSWKARYRQITDLCHRALVRFGERQGASEWVAESFSSELALASRELKQYYDNVDIMGSYESARVREARKYIFEGSNAFSLAQKLLLSRYALSVQQGLPPKRGLVRIEQGAE